MFKLGLIAVYCKLADLRLFIFWWIFSCLFIYVRKMETQFYF
jgi:hypothetical protein